MKNTKDVGIDLFEDYKNIPAKVQTILDKYEDAFVDGDYKQLEKAHKALNKIGYTFEYYLDGQAYDLRPIGTKGKSEMDQFKNGGNVIDGIEIPYEIDLLLKEQQILNKDVNLYSKQLNELPKNEMNLITDDAKKSNKYKEIKFKYDAAFNKLQNFGKKNTKLLNNFLKKIDRRVQQNIRLYYKNIADKLAKGGSLDNENSDMVLNKNNQISHHTKELANAVNKNKNIPAWVVAKINRSATDISDATHYLEGAKYKKGGKIIFCYTIGGL